MEGRVRVVPIREDTSPETPLAKSNSDPPPPPDGWQSPRGDAKAAHDALFGGIYGGGARFDWAMGSGKVHTFHASGPAGVALAMVVFLVIGALISAFFLFAVGLGTAVALGAGAVAALGLGANAARKRLTAGARGELGPRTTPPRSP
jgi:hypothetical protein